MFDFIRGSSGSFITKIIFGVIILVFIFWGVGNYTSIGQHAVATVNGEQITTVEFHKAINTALRNAETNSFRGDKAAFDAFKRDSLNRMILQILVRQEAERLGVLITPQELQHVLVTIPAFLDEKGAFDSARYLAVLGQGKMTPAEFEKDVASQLIMEKLMSYVAMGVSVTSEEVQNYFSFIREERLSEYILFSLKDYRKAAEPSEEAIADYYELHKDSFAMPARVAYEYIAVSPRTLAKKLTITDAAAQAEYDAHVDNFVSPAEYNLNMIVLDIPAEKAQDEASAIRQTIAERMKAGESFATLAGKFSVAPNAQENGGAMGWRSEDTLQPDLRRVITTLKNGEISEALLFDGRWYVFMVEDQKDARAIPFEEARDEIKKYLAESQVEKKFAELRDVADDGLRDGADFDALSATLGVKKENTELLAVEEADTALGLTEESTLNLIRVDAGKFAPASLETKDGFVVVSVKERLPKATLELDKVRKDIVEVLTHDASVKLALVDANACVQSIKDNQGALPEAYAKRTVISRKINRLTPEFAPLQGNGAQIVAELFAADKGIWLNQPYTLDEGVVVARVKSVVAAPEAEWATMEGLLTNALLQSKREMYIQTYIKQLTETAAIETNEAALEGITFS